VAPVAAAKKPPAKRAKAAVPLPETDDEDELMAAPPAPKVRSVLHRRGETAR